MVLHHRHKQRILTTIVTLIIFIIAFDVAIILGPYMDLATTLLYAFAVAIGLTTAYQCYNYRHSHEHITLVNTLTQIFLGTILFVSAVVMLILQSLFGIDFLQSYLYLSILVILLTFIFLKRFDQYLEREVQARYPMGDAPAPKATTPIAAKPVAKPSSASPVAMARPVARPAARPAVRPTARPTVARENPVKKMTFKHKGR